MRDATGRDSKFFRGKAIFEAWNSPLARFFVRTGWLGHGAGVGRNVAEGDKPQG
jgi:hypothetical protein